MKKLLLLLTIICLFLSAQSVHASITSNPSSSDSATVKDPMADEAVVKDALTEFKSLKRVERKARLQEARKTWKEYKAAKKAGTDPDTNTVLLAILAILLPPLAVYLHEHAVNGKFWLSVLLTLLFWLPGVVYALIVVLS
jgi:uncharacterized membrane protein YqaE (UPF0057 family)